MQAMLLATLQFERTRTGSTMSHILRIKFIIAAATLALLSPATADDYPVTGTWTYDNTSAQGAAADCSGSSTMSFSNGTRHDTVGSVPELKNKTARQTGPGQFQVVDTFYNGQTWGNV